MNLLQLFQDPAQLDLALALTQHEGHAAEQEALLARAGLGQAAQADLRAASRHFARMRAASGKPAGHVCLDENCLAEFVDGVLPASDLPAVERALAECPSCLKSALALAELTRELVPATPWTEVVLGIAKKGLRILQAPFEGFTEIGLQPVAVLRGPAPEAQSRRWELTQHGITATFTATLEEDGLTGITATFRRGDAPFAQGRVALRLDDALLEAQPLAGAEGCVFWHLEPGHYTLEIADITGEAAAFRFHIEAE